MSLSDFLSPEDRGRPLWTGCLHCPSRGSCTHYQSRISNEVLRRAAQHNRAGARYLQEQADALQQTVSRADDPVALLRAADETERALAELLRAQTGWLSECSG